MKNVPLMKSFLLKQWPVFFAEIEAKYEKKMRSLREELELRRKTEIHEIEEVSVYDCCLLFDRFTFIPASLSFFNLFK